MARPIKEGLDYFPLDVDIAQDDKFLMISAEHGNVGFAVMIKLLAKIYKEGYYYNWGIREQKLFANGVNVDINTLNDIVNTAIDERIFNETLFNEFGILTSKGIQMRYLEAIKRRKEAKFIAPYFLITDVAGVVGTSKIKVTTVDVDDNLINVDINPNSTGENDNISTQRKEKERKEKKSRVNNIITHKFEICDMESAKLLFQLMQENNPDVKQPNFDKWAEEIRKIRMLDKRPTEQIDWLIKWTQKDSFWSGNILSPTKLRKQWDQLVLKAKTDHEKKKQLQIGSGKVDKKRLEALLGDE